MRNPKESAGRPTRRDREFWDYSLALYARPGVAAACLRLQDRHGLDVNLLLLACYAGSTGPWLLNAVLLRRAEAAVQSWREQVIVPLRAARRGLRRHRPAPEAAALRAAVADLELAAERLAQDRLAGWLAGAAGLRRARPAAAVAGNLRLCLGRARPAADAAAAADAGRLLRAALQLRCPAGGGAAGGRLRPNGRRFPRRG